MEKREIDGNRLKVLNLHIKTTHTLMSVLSSTAEYAVIKPLKIMRQRNSARTALDMLNTAIKRLNQIRANLEASAASALIDAKKFYSGTRRKLALASMQRAHKDRVTKECIATAVFQLVAMRIEMEFKMKMDRNSSFSEETILAKSILARLTSTQTHIPSDGVLMRKLARLCRN